MTYHADSYSTDADNRIRKALPKGVKLIRTLRGHTGAIGRIAWSPDGKLLASPSEDKTVRIWNVDSGETIHTLTGHREDVLVATFSPSGKVLISGGGNEASRERDAGIRFWDVQNGNMLRQCGNHKAPISALVFHPTENIFVSGSYDGNVKLWEAGTGKSLGDLRRSNSEIFGLAYDSNGQTLAIGSTKGILLCESIDSNLIQRFSSNHNWATNVAWNQKQRILASAGEDKTIKIWDIDNNSLLSTFEGHTDAVICLGFNSTGQILASKARAEDCTVRFWNIQTGACIGEISELTNEAWYPGLAFHPYLPIVATVGSDPDAPPYRRANIIHIYEIDPSLLLRQQNEQSTQYVNAKVVLVGDTGVGKSGLSLVLNDQTFTATDSTPGRKVWTLNSTNVVTNDTLTQIRETLMWDLAGQPGYRIIHQLHLNEVAVALVVFDARSETDPLAGVRHWERALRLAQQRQGPTAVPMKKFLVSARNDRGGVPIGEDRLQSLLGEFGFDGFFKTSAKEGWQIAELKSAIESSIHWDKLPSVSSSLLFANIKSFLLDVKRTGRLLAPSNYLYDEFIHKHPSTATNVANLQAQFDTCIGRLENRDLIRQLTFGGYILLQPELLDAYSSAMVNTAREEPDGLGSLSEETALAGKFFVPREQKIADIRQEQLLLYATVEELVKHDLALRENADDGRYLVFPSQFNRDFEDAPEPKGKTVAITFDGPVQSLYSTLAVRLGHSGLFTTGRTEMWRNAAIFTAKAGGKCGLYLNEFSEGRGRLILFFPDDRSTEETRYHFEEFVLSHANKRALDGTIELVRFFICPNCGDPVPDNYVKRLREKDVLKFNCPCGGLVSLAEPKQRLLFKSQVEAMDIHADRQRDFDAFVMSAKGETTTKSFQDWAGSEQVTLAIVFTDVVGSTALGESIRDEAMNEVRRSHFIQSRKLIHHFGGREIKTIGDSFMASFRSVGAALDYAIKLQENTGHSQICIRAGIHIGPLLIDESDVFGGTVNFAARVIGAIKGAEIWISDRAKEDIDRIGSSGHQHLKWQRHDDIEMKGFPGKFTLWSIH